MSFSRSRAWRWVPSLYFAEGVPYAIVGTVSAVLLKNLEMSNRELAVWTSLLTFPWVVKPLWAPLLDLFSTKKHWIVVMQVLMGGGFAAAAGRDTARLYATGPGKTGPGTQERTI